MFKNKLDVLTPREHLITQHVANGMMNKVIAYDLNISEATVKAHLTNVMKKLKVRNRTQLALLSFNEFIEKVARGELENPALAARDFIHDSTVGLKGGVIWVV